MAADSIKAVDVANQLNQELQNYYQKTLDIKNLLVKEEEEIVEQIEALFNQREETRKRYDTLDENLMKLISQLKNEEVKKFADIKNQILESIADLDSENMQKIKLLYNKYKDKLKEINHGKTLVNAYQGLQPLVDGIFFDKKK